ncbi:MAG: hypothetical protein QOE79_2769 [Sphingomonadales bacterium]|nr:hypothetical protein [Sphingomonadales bacterium]MEA3050381.1 hypothetical protein [Sphingomonadales bacterium]
MKRKPPLKSDPKLGSPSPRPAPCLPGGAYRALKWLAILAIALTLAEFLAMDLAMVVAADAVFYLEMIVAGWALSTLALLNPAIGNKVILLGSHLFGNALGPPPRRPADLDRIEDA